MLTHCRCGSHVFLQFPASGQPPGLSKRAPLSGQGRGNVARFQCPPSEKEEGWGCISPGGRRKLGAAERDASPACSLCLLPLRGVYHSHPNTPSNVQWETGGYGIKMCKRSRGTNKEGLKATWEHTTCRVLSPSNKAPTPTPRAPKPRPVLPGSLLRPHPLDQTHLCPRDRGT